MDTWHRISTLQPQVHSHDQHAERNAGYAKLEAKVGSEYRIRNNVPLSVVGGCKAFSRAINASKILQGS